MNWGVKMKKILFIIAVIAFCYLHTSQMFSAEDYKNKIIGSWVSTNHKGGPQYQRTLIFKANNVFLEKFFDNEGLPALYKSKYKVEGNRIILAPEKGRTSYFKIDSVTSDFIVARLVGKNSDNEIYYSEVVKLKKKQDKKKVVISLKSTNSMSRILKPCISECRKKYSDGKDPTEKFYKECSDLRFNIEVLKLDLLRSAEKLVSAKDDAGRKKAKDSMDDVEKNILESIKKTCPTQAKKTYYDIMH